MPLLSWSARRIPVTDYEGMPLTPDRIRHALSEIHTILFEEKDTNRTGKMKSMLPEDAVKIFKVLGIPLERSSILN